MSHAHLTIDDMKEVAGSIVDIHVDRRDRRSTEDILDDLKRRKLQESQKKSEEKNLPEPEPVISDDK